MPAAAPRADGTRELGPKCCPAKQGRYGHGFLMTIRREIGVNNLCRDSTSTIPAALEFSTYVDRMRTCFHRRPEPGPAGRRLHACGGASRTISTSTMPAAPKPAGPSWQGPCPCQPRWRPACHYLPGQARAFGAPTGHVRCGLRRAGRGGSFLGRAPTPRPWKGARCSECSPSWPNSNEGPSPQILATVSPLPAPADERGKMPEADARPGPPRPAALRCGESPLPRMADLLQVPRCTIYGHLNKEGIGRRANGKGLMQRSIRPHYSQDPDKDTGRRSSPVLDLRFAPHSETRQFLLQRFFPGAIKNLSR